MSKELRECPFCGKPAKWEKKFLIGGIARCSDYQCIGAFTHLSRSAASGEWNTRPAEEALKAENERLKSVIAEIAATLATGSEISEDDIFTMCKDAVGEKAVLDRYNEKLRERVGDIENDSDR